ncbi:MAG: hypothetical protein OXF20_07210, partial [Gammaproteobacteria bacterium]|nr:hypothetical protein [Gammaproteobacteria bacterium]
MIISLVMVIMLTILVPVTHAGLSSSFAGTEQAGGALGNILHKGKEALSKSMNCVVKDDRDCMKIAEEFLSSAKGEILFGSSVLANVRDISQGAAKAVSKLNKFAADSKQGFDNAARALAISKSRRDDRWSEEQSIDFHEKPLQGIKTALVRKLPSVRAGHSGSAGELPAPELSLSSGEPEKWKDYRKYRSAAVANWERNATEKQKSFRRTTGAGPEVMNFHEYLQRQESGGAYSDAVAGMNAGGGYASALGGLDEKEEEQRRQRQRAEEERMRQEEARQRELARAEREAEEERTREEEERELARVEQERERQRQHEREEREREEEYRRMERLEQAQQRAIRQQAWQNIAESLN